MCLALFGVFQQEFLSFGEVSIKGCTGQEPELSTLPAKRKIDKHMKQIEMMNKMQMMGNKEIGATRIPEIYLFQVWKLGKVDLQSMQRLTNDSVHLSCLCCVEEVTSGASKDASSKFIMSNRNN